MITFVAIAKYREPISHFRIPWISEAICWASWHFPLPSSSVKLALSRNAATRPALISVIMLSLSSIVDWLRHTLHLCFVLFVASHATKPIRGVQSADKFHLYGLAASQQQFWCILSVSQWPKTKTFSDHPSHAPPLSRCRFDFLGAVSVSAPVSPVQAYSMQCRGAFTESSAYLLELFPEFEFRPMCALLISIVFTSIFCRTFETNTCVILAYGAFS